MLCAAVADALALLSRCFCFTAHKLYPLRVRVVNCVTKKQEWTTVAYIPMVRKQRESAADERGRERRAAVLQRVLYLVFRSTITASHDGVTIDYKGRKLKAFPRILLYLCDYPEEKAVLGLKSGQTALPCSTCDVNVAEMGGPQALCSHERDAVQLLENQLEASRLRVQHRLSERRNHLERLHSMRSTVPALAGMAGLSSAPFLMYQVVGFDALHVRILICSWREGGLCECVAELSCKK